MATAARPVESIGESWGEIPAPRQASGSDRGRGSEPRCASRLAARAAWLESEIMPHGEWLRGWIARRFPTEADVDDLVQESFERILGHADPAAVRNARAYLGQTAQRLVFDRLRRRCIVQIDYHEDLSDLGLVCAYPLPDQACAAREEWARVAEGFAALPDRTREIVRLRRIEGLSQRDTAAAVGVTESAIEKHLRRGTDALREERGGDSAGIGAGVLPEQG